MASCLFSSPALAREFLYDLCVKTYPEILARNTSSIQLDTVGYLHKQSNFSRFTIDSQIMTKLTFLTFSKKESN